MKQILYTLFTIMLMQSCSSGTKIEPKQSPLGASYFSKTYITSLIITPEWHFGYNPNTDLFAIGHSSKRENVITSGETFDQICNKYGDIFFNGYYTYLPFNCLFADEFITIDLICSIDFDADHPAGTSLADIAMVHASSPYKFIKSGYKNEFEWSKKPEGFRGYLMGVDNGFHIIYKLMSEMKTEDMILLNSEIRFTFTKPRPEGKQTYTITLKTADKTYSASCEIK